LRRKEPRRQARPAAFQGRIRKTRATRAAPREKILDLRFQSEDRTGCAQAAALPRAAPFLLVHSFDGVNRRSLSAGSITVDKRVSR
jgi:hypothetical protein